MQITYDILMCFVRQSVLCESPNIKSDHQTLNLRLTLDKMSFPIDTATNFAHELRPPVPEDPAIFLPFFTDDAIVFEHCPKIMSTPPAKFIAKEFKGKGEIAEYFKLLGETLQAKEMVVDKWWNVEGDGFKTEVLGGRGEAVW